MNKYELAEQRSICLCVRDWGEHGGLLKDGLPSDTQRFNIGGRAVQDLICVPFTVIPEERE